MQLNETRVRERAYKIWESEGKPEGCADQHWNMACQYEQATPDDELDHHAEGDHDIDVHPLKTPQQKKKSKHSRH